MFVLLRQELHLLGVLLQLRLQGGGLLLVLPREVGHQLREIVDPRAQDVQLLDVLLLINPRMTTSLYLARRP